MYCRRENEYDRTIWSRNSLLPINAAQPRAFCNGGFFRRTDRLDGSGSRHQNGRFLPDADKTRRVPAKEYKGRSPALLDKAASVTQCGVWCVVHIKGTLPSNPD